MENALFWFAAIVTKLTDYWRVKIDQRRNYRRFSAWLDGQRTPERIWTFSEKNNRWVSLDSYAEQHPDVVTGIDYGYDLAPIEELESRHR